MKGTMLFWCIPMHTKYKYLYFPFHSMDYQYDYVLVHMLFYCSHFMFRLFFVLFLISIIVIIVVTIETTICSFFCYFFLVNVSNFILQFSLYRYMRFLPLMDLWYWIFLTIIIVLLLLLIPSYILSYFLKFGNTKHLFFFIL